MFCSKCGNQVAEDARFCTSCGSAIPGTAGPAQPQPPTRPQTPAQAPPRAAAPPPLPPRPASASGAGIEPPPVTTAPDQWGFVQFGAGQSTAPPHSGMPTWAIILIILGCCVFLAVIAGVLMGVPAYKGYMAKADYRAGKLQVAKLGQDIDAYTLDNSSPPKALLDLLNKPGDAPSWNGPYAKSGDLIDPWGHAFGYVVPGQHGAFDIIFYGRDGQPGGDGVDADYGNWEGDSGTAASASDDTSTQSQSTTSAATAAAPATTTEANTNEQQVTANTPDPQQIEQLCRAAAHKRMEEGSGGLMGAVMNSNTEDGAEMRLGAESSIETTCHSIAQKCIDGESTCTVENGELHVVSKQHPSSQSSGAAESAASIVLPTTIAASSSASNQQEQAEVANAEKELATAQAARNQAEQDRTNAAAALAQARAAREQAEEARNVQAAPQQPDANSEQSQPAAEDQHSISAPSPSQATPARPSPDDEYHRRTGSECARGFIGKSCRHNIREQVCANIAPGSAGASVCSQ